MNILDPQGPIGVAERTILIDSVAIMLAIVLPTVIAILGFAFWFRASNARAFYWPNWEYSGRIELVVWAIPALTVILLGGVAWIGAHQLDPAKPIEGTENPLIIQAVSLDWKWLFIYPDQNVATINTLTVPAGRPLQFQLTSASVMNVFFKWAEDASGAERSLDAASYTEIAKPSIGSKPAVYRLADPDLFNAIVTQKLPPSPGVQSGVSGASPNAGVADAR
jgi:hypothetical protein